MLKLKLQYIGHLMQRSDSFEKILVLGEIEGGKRGVWFPPIWIQRLCSCSVGAQLLNVPEHPISSSGVATCVHTESLQSCLTLCDPMVL